MEDKAVHQIAEAFRMVLSEGEADTQERRAILIKRIPIICNDVMQIKNDLRWMKWIGSGFVTAAGLLAFKALTG
jgi:hypothetical protein